MIKGKKKQIYKSLFLCHLTEPKDPKVTCKVKFYKFPYSTWSEKDLTLIQMCFFSNVLGLGFCIVVVS